MSRSLWDPVDPTQVGSVAPGFQYRVNGEVYRFAREETLRRFMQSPTRYCGMLRDAVSGNRFEPTPRSPEVFWIGGPYFFQSDSTKATFIADPQRYSVIRLM